MPKYHKLHRGSVLALFVASSISSYFNPNMIQIAAFSIFGVIAYDVVCYFKEKNSPKDHSQDIRDIVEQVKENTQHIKEMKDDVSVAKLAHSFKRG